MAGGPLPAFLRHLRRLAVRKETDRLADQDLLERFAAGRDEAAFAALVQRYGPLVLRVARRTLLDYHAAEDVFQATFLVLACRAASIRKRKALGSWLYGVTHRLAVRARGKAAQRRLHEQQQPSSRPYTDPATEVSGREQEAVLDEELALMAERFRAPLVLCFLEGKTQDEAARQLGWSRNTFLRRMEEGKKRLRLRLARRGVVLSAGLIAATVSQASSAAAVSPALLDSTIEAALDFGAGNALAGGVSASAAALAKGAMKTMSLTKLKLVAVAVLTVGVLGTTGGMLTYRALISKTAKAADSRPATPVPKRPTEPEAKAAEPGADDPVKRGLKDALPAALATADPYLLTFALIGLAKTQHASGDRDAALATFRVADRVAGTVANAHLRRLALMRTAVARGKIGDKEPAWATLDRFAREATGLSADARYNLMSMIIDFQFDAGFKSEARANLKTELALVEAIADEHVKDGGIYRLLHNQIKLGDYDGALRQAERYRDGRSNVRASLLELIVRYRSRPGDPPAARKVVERALDLSRGVTYPYPRALAQSQIAAALARAGDIDGALNLARALGKDEVGDSIRAEVPGTLGEIARAQAKAGAPVAAKETLREAFAIAQTLPQRNVVFCERVRRVVEAQCEIGDVEGAKASAALIENDNVDKALALAALARAQAKAGDAPSARATLHDALTFASGSLALPTVINDNPGANSGRVLREVALAQAETGDAKAALKTVAGQGSDAWRSETLAAIAPIQARLGDIPGALTTARSIPDATRAGEAYSSIASIQARSGDADSALSWASRLDAPVAKAFALIGITEGLAARKAEKPGEHR